MISILPLIIAIMLSSCSLSLFLPAMLYPFQTDARRLFLLADSLRETDKVREWLQHQLVLLLSDNCSDNFARRTVIHNPKEMAQITTFLGQKLTVDVILGHLTTFLNAKVRSLMIHYLNSALFLTLS